MHIEDVVARLYLSLKCTSRNNFSFHSRSTMYILKTLLESFNPLPNTERETSWILFHRIRTQIQWIQLKFNCGSSQAAALHALYANRGQIYERIARLQIVEDSVSIKFRKCRQPNVFDFQWPESSIFNQM